MAPDQRRAALVAATLPLLREHGLAVSTRQIAEAAGVAEGTIFNVFPDKASLLRAAVLAAFDPDPLVDSLTGVAGQGDLRSRLREVVKLLRWRLGANVALIAAVRTVAGEADPQFRDRMTYARRRMLDGLTAVFEPDAALLRRDPRTAARLLFMLVMSTVHAGFGGDANALSELDDDEVVSLLLDGLLVRPVRTGGTA
jgi:AcrR family transcriptional regulator